MTFALQFFVLRLTAVAVGALDAACVDGTLACCRASGTVGMAMLQKASRPARSRSPSWGAQDLVVTAAGREDAIATESEAEAALWAGSDAVPKWYFDNLHAASAGNVGVGFVGVTKNFTTVQIAGMFDSGTNLLGATMMKNFADFALLCPGGAEEGFSCNWWKHTSPNENEARMNNRTLLIQMVRSPLAHITAWSKASYDLGHCPDDYDMPCNVSGTAYPGGVSDVWNKYTEGYDRAAEQHGNAMVVEYEKLVIEPEKVMTSIAGKLGIGLPEPVEIVGLPAKNHGLPVGRQVAMAKIQDMTYLSLPHLESNAIRRDICQRLSTEVMSVHEIPSNPKRMYSDDCSH